MKKVFTMAAICAASLIFFTASAGSSAHAGTVRSSSGRVLPTYSSSSSSRSVGCDTLSNLTTMDSAFVFTWDTAYGGGYVSGNGSLNYGGPTKYTMTAIGEKFEAHSGRTGQYVSASFMEFAVVIINPTHADSAKTVTAYVYDTTGTGLYGGYAPGHALDSATTTLAAIAAAQGLGAFSFTHNVQFSGKGFFIVLALPQAAGDTLVLAINQGTTGNGNGWLATSNPAGAWTSYDSLFAAPQGNFIFAVVCGTNCPTITATATQLNGTTSASVTASGGAGPYTYTWSNPTHQTSDTATGLVGGHSYTVTVTDHNGCIGTATVSIVTGIDHINGMTDFNIYPNPSNGIFTASASFASATDVTISIADVRGSKIYESTDKAVKDLSKPINLSAMSPGVYFVNVRTETGSANQRIVIK